MRRAAIVLIFLCLCPIFALADVPALSDVEAIIQQEHPAEMDIRGMEFADVKYLVDTYPDIRFHYTVRLANVDVDSEATEASLDTDRPKRPDAKELHERLQYLPNLTKLDMFKYMHSKADMALLFDSYPGIRFGFTVQVAHKKIRTDLTAFSTLSPPQRYKNKDFENLRFCYQLLALDIGHNAVDDLSFLQYLPNLRVLIVADNRLTDISPIGQLKDLEYLEIFQNRITDLSPLKQNQKLIDLNVSWNKTLCDYESLLELPNLQRLWYVNTALTEEGRQALTERFPEAQIVFEAEHSTAGGWRKHPRYDVLREMFFHWTYSPFPALTETPENE